MSYRNECHFMKTVDDDGNAANAPNIVEPGQNDESAPISASATTNLGGPGGWLSAEASLLYGSNSTNNLPLHGSSLTPSSGSMYDKSGSSSGRVTGFGQSESSGDNNMSGSPDGDQSNRPTPNSTASDPRVSMAGGLDGSGRNSFDTNSATAQSNNNARGSADANANYFNDAGGFGIRTGLTPNQRFSMPDTPGADFGMPNGWGDLQGQTGMTPVAEGVLRSLMNMGPMDAMDLSSWDATN